MFFKRKKRQAPSLNTTSTADISFMLLTFFLVTSSMDIDKVMTRPLPKEEKEEPQVVNIDKRTVMQIAIMEDNSLRIGETAIARKQLRERVMKFVKSNLKQHLIVIDANPGADYSAYFFVENEVAAAYEGLRNDYAQSQYGRPMSACSEEQKADVAKACPIRISETCTIEAQKGGQDVP